MRLAEPGDPILEPPQAPWNPEEGIGWLYLVSHPDRSQRQSDPVLTQETIPYYESLLTSDMEFGPGYYDREEIWRQMRIELRRNGVQLHNNHWGKTEFYLEVYDRLRKAGTTIAGTASALGKPVDTIKKAHKAARQRIFGRDTPPATEEATVHSPEQGHDLPQESFETHSANCASYKAGQLCYLCERLLFAEPGITDEKEMNSKVISGTKGMDIISGRYDVAVEPDCYRGWRPQTEGCKQIQTEGYSDSDMGKEPYSPLPTSCNCLEQPCSLHDTHRRWTH